MAPAKRDWHQLAAQLRTETDSEKMLGLALELEGVMEKDGIVRADDSRHSPRTQARAKWGHGPQTHGPQPQEELGSPIAAPKGVLRIHGGSAGNILENEVTKVLKSPGRS